MGRKILIIGGGASGIMAAITAAENDASVTIYEKQDRVGKKILATGNGKCNLTNRNLSVENYYTGSDEKLKKCFLTFDAEDTLLFFKGCGLLLKDKNGYIYPACEQAAVVLDILRSKMDQLAIKIVTACKDIGIEQSGKEFLVRSNIGKEVFDSIIFACGSPAGMKPNQDKTGYDYARELGHTIIPVLPALVQIGCREELFKSVAGVRCDALLSLYEGSALLAKERGELQLTDYGISGIPVFQFSHIAAQKLAEHKELRVEIDFLPDYEEDAWKQFVMARILLKTGATVENFFLGLLHKKLCAMMIKQGQLKPQDIVSRNNEKMIQKICYEMKHFGVAPDRVNPYENAQVCSGGVDFTQLGDNLESLLLPGIYFCGEMIDIDGKCGGYNLQWAWTSGYIAGRACATVK